MDLRELETYRLEDAVRFHDRLNPRIWGPDEQMLPQVRERLLAIADDFRESLGIDVEVKDITISGSNAAYTYTPKSDIDLHLVADLPQADESDVYRELFDAKKYQYNDEHDFRIGPYDVELYVQDARKPHYSQGIYSIQDDRWLSVPKRRRPEVNDISVQSKYEDIGTRIEQAIQSGDLARMDAIARKIRDMRQAGLETTGEFGPENLAFKILRNNGTLQKLKQARLAAKDREMSLQERRKKKRGSKKKWGVFGGYYYPGFGYYGSGEASGDSGGGGDGGGESRTEDYDPNAEPPGPETKPEMPAGTVLVNVSDVYDWYKLGQDISDLSHADPRAYGKGAPQTVLSFGSEPIEHLYKKNLDRLGMKTFDIDRRAKRKDPEGAYRMDEAADAEGMLKRFVAFTAGQLGIDHLPTIKFKRDPAWSERNNTFGRYVPEEQTLYVSLTGRHPLDIMRTIAHELTHHRQNEREPMPDHAGETGSDWENEANARAGIIMRRFADLHPELFGSDRPIDESLRGKLGAAAAAACIAGTPGCATTDITAADALRGVQAVGRAVQATKPYGTASRSDIIRAAAEEEFRQAVKDWIRSGRKGPAPQPPADIQQESDEPLLKLDDPIINYDIPYSAIARPERLQQARRFGRISHYGSPAASSAIISVPVSKERPFLDTMRGLNIPVVKSRVYEASGYIPTKREKNDPRYKMALTVDVKPGQTGKEANKLGLKTDSQGRPQLLMKKLANLLEAAKADVPPTAQALYREMWAEVEDLIQARQSSATNPHHIRSLESRIQEIQRELAGEGYRFDYATGRLEALNEACWTGYRKQGMKRKGDRMVPNCVKVSEESQRKMLDFDSLYGKVFRITDNSGDPNAQGFSIITPLNPEPWRTWKEKPQFKDLVKRKLNEPGWLDDHKYNQIISVIQGEKFEPSKHIAESQEDLLEVKMSPGELRRWAESPEAEGIKAGFEAEMIFRDTAGGDSEDYEPDYEMDERARDIDEVVDFFRGGDEGISGGMANRLRENLWEEYVEWRDSAIYNQFEEVADEQVRDYMETNVWGDDTEQDRYRERAAEELGIETSEQSAEQSEEIENRARELFDADVEFQIEEQGQYFDDAREYYRDMMVDGDEFDQSDWFRNNYSHMSDVAEGFGLDWPYWTGGRQGSGSRSVEDIAESLQYAIDMPVVGSSNYHGTTRRPGRWIIEPDGSLDPDEPDDELGLEIVSPPMPLPETLRKLQQVLDWANGDGNAYTNSSTGLHMGMSIPFKGGDVDYIKLILFMGDQYVLDRFGRAANTYCASALEKLRQVQTARRRGVREQDAKSMTGAEKTAAAMDLMRKNLIELAEQLVRDGVGLSKYTSAHIKDDYIEFRSPGGDYLSLNDREDQALEDTMLRFARAMYIAGRPDVERREYAKKLYKLIDPQDNESLRLFLDYSTGKLNSEELKKQWAEQVLAKEAPPQRSQEDARQYEVVRRDTGEIIDTIQDWSLKSANETALVKYSGKGFDWSVREKTDAEPEKKLSRRAQVAKRIRERPSIWRVTDTNTGRSITVAADGTQDAKYQARREDSDFQRLFYNDPDSMLVEPASAEEVKQYRVQQADNAKDSEQVQQRVAGTQDRYNMYVVNWTERRGAGYGRDSLRVSAANADAAMDSVRSALNAQNRDVVSIEANLAGSTQDRQQQRAQQAQQSAGEFTGRWNIRDAQSGEVLHTISGIGNNQGDANRHAREWIERTGYSGAYEIVPEMR